VTPEIWFNAEGAAKRIAAFVASRPGRLRDSGVRRAVGIVGAPGLGKTTMSDFLRRLLDDSEVAHLDAYLLLRAERRSLGASGFEPRGHDLASTVRDVRAFLEAGAPLQLRPYLRSGVHGEACAVQPAGTVFFDGVAVWLAPDLRALIDTLIVFAADHDTMRALRLYRDLHDRDYTREEAEHLWAAEWPALESNILPAVSAADLVVRVSPERQYCLQEAG
jgi:uridine kinase